MAKKKDNKEDEERKLLLLFAEDLRAFTVPDTALERTRLAQLLEAKRQSLAATPDLLDQYVVELIHRCPNFLDGPAGFAWVEQRYKLLLNRVRTFPDISKKYWSEMLPKVRKSFVPSGRKQSPDNRQRDIYQAMGVHILMNEGMKKTEAVTKLIMGAAKCGLMVDQKEIFRALKQIEQQVAGTYQNLLHSPNTERNQKNAAIFFDMLKRQADPKTATKVLSPKEKALMGTFSKWFVKPPRGRKINPKVVRRKK